MKFDAVSFSACFQGKLRSWKCIKNSFAYCWSLNDESIQLAHEYASLHYHGHKRIHYLKEIEAPSSPRAIEAATKSLRERHHNLYQWYYQHSDETYFMVPCDDDVTKSNEGAGVIRLSSHFHECRSRIASHVHSGKSDPDRAAVVVLGLRCIRHQNYIV